MESEKYYIKISPGVLENDIVSETYDGNTFGVYTGMTQILGGGTNGDSILTGLTIPVLFKDSFNDYALFDFNDVLDIQELQLKFQMNQIESVKTYFVQTTIINYLTN